MCMLTENNIDGDLIPRYGPHESIQKSRLDQSHISINNYGTKCTKKKMKTRESIEDV